jgi:hypothetical protein
MKKSNSFVSNTDKDTTKQHLDQQYALHDTHLRLHWPNNQGHYNSKMIE